MRFALTPLSQVMYKGEANLFTTALQFPTLIIEKQRSMNQKTRYKIQDFPKTHKGLQWKLRDLQQRPSYSLNDPKE